MNAQVKQLWIDALRSGKYSQGRGALRSCDGMCCLGVLCDLYDREHGTNNWSDYIGTHGMYYMEAIEFPSPEVLKWAGLRNEDPEVVRRYADCNANTTLSNLNDEGKTFSQIADVIEAQL